VSTNGLLAEPRQALPAISKCLHNSEHDWIAPRTTPGSASNLRDFD